MGYKGDVLKIFKKKFYNWNIQLINTGKNTMRGELKRLKKYLEHETFMLTYGDSLNDVNLKSLLNFHKKNKIMTLTCGEASRFGAIKINNNYVSYFKEKSKLDEVGLMVVFS